MARNYRPLFRFALGPALVCLAALQPLHAQLDTRLQGSRTDFLDLFQQSVNLVMKPEVVTVFDFSGSMAQVMYHKDYPGGGDETNAGMAFTLRTGNGTNTTASKDKYGTIMATGRFDVIVNLTSGLTLTNGSLVRPDGSLLEYATAGDTAINTNYTKSNPLLGGESNTVGFKFASDVRNWIRSASHVRFTGGTSSKTFDLPLCWTILDANTTVDLANPNVDLRQFRKSYNSSYPLKMTIINPSTASNTEIEMDAAYRVMPNTTGNYGLFSATTGTAPMTACTFRNGNNTSQNFVGWGQNYITWIFNTSTTIPQATSAAGKAFANGIPARTRVQAVKDAAMRTWCKYYNKVFWAYRSLKYYGTASGTTTGQQDSASNPSNDSRNNASVADPTTTAVFGASQRAWTLLTDGTSTPRSDVGLKRLGYMVCGGSTPLNSALSNTLAQLNDPNNVFNDIETGVDKPVECRNTYVLLFTDGIPNSDPPSDAVSAYVNTPYITSGSGSASAGNAVFKADKTKIDTANGANYYNIINLAALAAHGGNEAINGFTVPTYPTTTQTYPGTTGWLTSQWIPFWMRGRGAGTEKITFSKPRPITTMTIGVSLKGTNTDTTGTKYRLFAAAACGDPSRDTWDLNALTAFTLIDPADPSKGKTPSSVYFFDATDPQKLTTGLDAAFAELSLQSNINVNANPNLPYIGATFGKQVYFGKFQPPKTGGTIWDGDLLAFSTRESATGIDILNAAGNVTTTLDETTAIWSAKTYLKTVSATPATDPAWWRNRKLYTRIPGTVATPEPGLTRFSDIDTLASPDNNAYTKIKTYTVPTATDVDRKKVIQFIMGGDTTGTLDAALRPLKNRDSIMGDIINSSPTAIEYTWPVWFQSSLPTSLSGASGNRFRLIFVGTNQGWLHAFGEVSQVSTVIDSNGIQQEVIQASIGELWSFLPTDFLQNLSYVTQTANPHRFLVDGTPTIYHLDIPPSSGAAANGTVDGTSAADAERAMVIIGLRKGGRSYYAIDISAPTAPVLKWSLVPDEAASFGFPAARIEAGGPSVATVTTIVKAMGYSTATPSIGRMMFNGKMKDVVFFSGGLGLPEIEANYLAAAPSGMGRSVLALDVNTGKVLAAVDMTTISATVSSIPAGVVPFEFILNSGMAQRAYFLDGGGGLWAWGSRETATSAPYQGFRLDSSDLAKWTSNGAVGSSPGIRPVAQDLSGVNAKYSTLPAPFRIGSFPGKGATVSSVVQSPPAAVGIAMVSGDRNNPLDDYTINPASKPSSHRLTVVFDRQDSKSWLSGNIDAHGIYDSNLKNLRTATATDFDPANTNYYLAPASGNPFFGYYLDFQPVATAPFVNKGISEPMVVAGTLFYSYFNPTDSDPCTGGNGQSHSMRICDVINPQIINVSGVACTTGEVTYYSGVSTAYLAYGTRGVLQAGVTSTGVPTASGSTTTPRIDRFTGRQQERFPKPRVWRTVR